MRITDLYFSWWLRPGKVRTVVVGGLNRTYVVHAPKGHDLKTPLTLVLALRWGSVGGAMRAWLPGVNRRSDWEGFSTVYPSGTGANSSFCGNGGGSARDDKVDDVAFIAALLDVLELAYSVE